MLHPVIPQAAPLKSQINGEWPLVTMLLVVVLDVLVNETRKEIARSSNYVLVKRRPN